VLISHKSPSDAASVGRIVRYVSSVTRDASSIKAATRLKNPRTLAALSGSPMMRDPFGERNRCLLSSPSPNAQPASSTKGAEFVRRLGIRVKGDGDTRHRLRSRTGRASSGCRRARQSARVFKRVAAVDRRGVAGDDETYRTMRPTLAASDGDLWLMSTPNGKRDSCMKSGRMEARSGAILATGSDCSRLENGFLEEERAKSEGISAGVSVRVRGERRGGVFAGVD